MAHSKYKILLNIFEILHLQNTAIPMCPFNDLLHPDFVQDFDYYLRDDKV